MSENKMPAEIDELKDRFAKLRDQKIQNDAKLESAEQELEKLRAQARTEYGTDDLDELSRRLEQMELENLARRNEYDELLTSIESRLSEIEQEYQSNE